MKRVAKGSRRSVFSISRGCPATSEPSDRGTDSSPTRVAQLGSPLSIAGQSRGFHPQFRDAYAAPEVVPMGGCFHTSSTNVSHHGPAARAGERRAARRRRAPYWGLLCALVLLTVGCSGST